MVVEKTRSPIETCSPPLEKRLWSFDSTNESRLSNTPEQERQQDAQSPANTLVRDTSAEEIPLHCISGYIPSMSETIRPAIAAEREIHSSPGTMEPTLLPDPFEGLEVPPYRVLLSEDESSGDEATRGKKKGSKEKNAMELGPAALTASKRPRDDDDDAETEHSEDSARPWKKLDQPPPIPALIKAMDSSSLVEIGVQTKDSRVRSNESWISQPTPDQVTTGRAAGDPVYMKMIDTGVHGNLTFHITDAKGRFLATSSVDIGLSKGEFHAAKEMVASAFYTSKAQKLAHYAAAVELYRQRVEVFLLWHPPKNMNVMGVKTRESAWAEVKRSISKSKLNVDATTFKALSTNCRNRKNALQRELRDLKDRLIDNNLSREWLQAQEDLNIEDIVFRRSELFTSSLGPSLKGWYEEKRSDRRYKRTCLEAIDRGEIQGKQVKNLLAAAFAHVLGMDKAQFIQFRPGLAPRVKNVWW